MSDFSTGRNMHAMSRSDLLHFLWLTLGNVRPYKVQSKIVGCSVELGTILEFVSNVDFTF